MSKLFNALEQIRRNETYNVSGPNGNLTPNSERGLNLRLIVLFIVALAITGFLLLNLSTIREKLFSSPAKSSIASQPTPRQMLDNPVVKTTEKNQATTAKDNLNNYGAELITAQDYWHGIYILKKITEAQPGHIEPLINLGVALAELGLFGPANRYFSMAYALDSEHPALQENLTLLREAGLLDRPLAFYLKVRGKGGRITNGINLDEDEEP
ncbi:MAG: hypothetical protein KKB30_15175 [Proteobacteria bacterium]|nr:hypothetical protein [Pseudomonadota bacterium]MBU1716266.1 hypothetical protein [Pseudomonadota bacterium]